MQWGNNLDKAANLLHMFDMLTDADQVRFLDFLYRAEVQALGHIEALAPSHFRAIFPPCYYRQDSSRSNVISIDGWQRDHNARQVSVEKIQWGSGLDRHLSLIHMFNVLTAAHQKALLDFTYRRMVETFGRRAEFVPVSKPAHCRGWEADAVSNVIEISAGRR